MLGPLWLPLRRFAANDDKEEFEVKQQVDVGGMGIDSFSQKELDLIVTKRGDPSLE